MNDLAALAKKAGVRGQLTEQDAAAGTQVAIWRHSDGVDVDALDPQAEQLADYLEKKAKKAAEPQASLTLDPPVVMRPPGRAARPGHRPHRRAERHGLPARGRGHLRHTDRGRQG